ncbi:MAG: hypothetical protein PF569_08765 [Candidatus Woesearchaeota archaeon]|jgi:hypothetical protein|nr:hypothetical protein [Candidatus Woesearchaeota archaeon]
MIASDLKDLILSKLINPYPENATQANSKWGEAFKEYFEANCDITCSWSATDPSNGSTDPLTSFTAKPVFTSFPIVPKDNRTLWLSNLNTILISGNIIPDSSFSTLSLAPLKLTTTVFSITMNQSTDPDVVIEDFCQKIINGIKTMIGGTTTGTNSSFVGSATVTSIS